MKEENTSDKNIKSNFNKTVKDIFFNKELQRMLILIGILFLILFIIFIFKKVGTEKNANKNIKVQFKNTDILKSINNTFNKKEKMISLNMKATPFELADIERINNSDYEYHYDKNKKEYDKEMEREIDAFLDTIDFFNHLNYKIYLSEDEKNNINELGLKINAEKENILLFNLKTEKEKIYLNEDYAYKLSLEGNTLMKDRFNQKYKLASRSIIDIEKNIFKIFESSPVIRKEVSNIFEFKNKDGALEIMIKEDFKIEDFKSFTEKIASELLKEPVNEYFYNTLKIYEEFILPILEGDLREFSTEYQVNIEDINSFLQEVINGEYLEEMTNEEKKDIIKSLNKIKKIKILLKIKNDLIDSLEIYLPELGVADAIDAETVFKNLSINVSFNYNKNEINKEFAKKLNFKVRKIDEVMEIYDYIEDKEMEDILSKLQYFRRIDKETVEERVDNIFSSVIKLINYIFE